MSYNLTHHDLTSSNYYRYQQLPAATRKLSEIQNENIKTIIFTIEVANL